MAIHLNRRVVAGAAVLLTVSSLLAACGGSSDTPDATPATGSQAPQASKPPAVPKELKIITTNSNGVYAKQVKVGDDPYIKEMSKLSGYDLKFDVLGANQEYTQQLTIRFASKDLGDLIRTDSIDSAIHLGAVDQGVFKDLGPLIDKYGPNLKKKIPQEAWDSPKVSKNGKIYGIPAFLAAPATRIVYIRQDWLDKLGMKQPKTIDEFLAYFEAVKKEDVNGNGDPGDEYGFYVRENLLYSDLFFAEHGAHPGVWKVVNGQMTPEMILPEMKDALNFWKMLYDKGYVNPNLFTNKSADWIAGIQQGKAGMWIHDVQNVLTTWSNANFLNQPNVKLSMIDGPTGPKGKGVTPQGDGMLFVWVVPEQSKNAEDVIKFLDWAWSDEAETFFAHGIQGTNYTMENGKVKWDPASLVNTDKEASVFYQVSLNPRGDGRMMQKVLDFNPAGDTLKAGFVKANANLIKRAELNMPVLKALENKPELALGTNTGTLFMDMFAKVVTGKEQVDPAFEKFVSEWKRRGGDAAMKEATDWYNNYTKAKK
ncbi:extracellular solute-binding protein [Paenibacillus koleovorans]|uniref:extracellular solute-binding protein n=1 Tax=Paenibacillus koleovorans TaxID=121608 RepID=UPI0013E33DBE|nr:extracellular solute-binding protein [Paenibacillus koleovorans]